MNLTLLGLGMGSGRYLGVTKVRDALLEVVRYRTFSGGICLANERTIGRLRYLQHELGIQFTYQESLESIHKRFEVSRDCVVPVSPFRSGAPFTVTSLLQDIELLIAAGRTGLDWWWLPFGTTVNEISTDVSRTEGFLRAHYLRATALYREVVRTSFSKISEALPFYMAMPLRWELAVVQSSTGWGPTIHWRWLPVAHEDQANVDCQFASSVPVDFQNVEPHFGALRASLLRLGRDCGRYSLGGMEPLPTPGPSDAVGRVTGETSAMREAGGWLASEIKSLFSDLPGHGPMLGDITL